jgi:1-aminocyclopropane-1-carboxylate deaminase
MHAPCFAVPPPLNASSPSSNRPRRWRPAAAAAAASPPPSPSPTPITPLTFRGRTVFIKRDDTLRIQGLTGSKARKFRSLTRPSALADVAALASFGGTQSNAMASLARLARHHAIPFFYYTARPVPPHVARQTAGNLPAALTAGMQLRRIPPDVYARAFMHVPSADGGAGGGWCDARAWLVEDVRDVCPDAERLLFLPQGGAWPGAEDGVAELARELAAQLAEMRSDGRLRFPAKPPVVFLGAGTGATALFLARHLRGRCKVVAVPVAGDAEYLVRQMRALDGAGGAGTMVDMRDDAVLPEVLRPRVRSSFADVREGKLLMWRELERAAAAAAAAACGDGDAALHFDLVYGPNAWEEVWLAIDEGRLGGDSDLVFLHTGGQEGNMSMLDRFCFKGLLTRAQADALGGGG